MRKKINLHKIILLTIIMFSTSISFAQKTDFLINGKLKDKDSNEALSFASIIIKNSNDSILSGIITDSKGEFIINIGRGAYILDISYLGYVSREINISVNNNVYLGNIQMKKDFKLLGEVTIKSSNQIVKSDRDIHIITEEFKENTSSVNDILPKIRGIHIDPLSNQISLNNDANVLLLVDGNVKNQDYIKNISPEKVLRIEVIRNPTGRYLTEGYAAVINIILKKNYSGYDIFVKQKGLYSLDKSNGDDFLFKNNAEVNLAYTRKKINIYGIYSNTISNTNLPSIISTNINGIALNKKSIDDKPNYHNNSLSHNAILGVDAFLNSKHSLSIETMYKKKPFTFNNHEEAYVNSFTKDNSLLSEFTSSQKNNNQMNNVLGLLAYRWDISNNKELNVDYGYNFSEGQDSYLYYENDTLKTNQTINFNNIYSRLEVDYSQDFNNTYSINIGYHNTVKNNDNKYTDISNTTYNSEYAEIRNTIYSYLNINNSKKITSKLGFAVEQNKIHSLTQNPTYYSLQPFLSVFYKKSKATNFTFKFRSYSDYPTNTQIEPFEIKIDRLTSQIGNLDLSYTTYYKTSVDFNFLKNRLSIEPYYLFTSNFISKTGVLDNQKYIYSYSNIDKYESIGLSISFKYPIISKKLFFNFTGAIYGDRIIYNDNKNEFLDFDINSNVMYRYARYNTILALMLKKKNSKQIQTYGYYSNDNDYLAIFMRQAFFKNRFVVSALYILPISLGFNYEIENKYEHNGFAEYSYKDISVTKNLFMLKLTYSFSKGQDIRSINKKELMEQKQNKGFF